MQKLFEKYKSPIAVILLIILLGGVFSYTNMKTSLFPDITFPKIKVIAENGEQPIDRMMITVTKPLEIAIKKVENLKMIRSTTSVGTCEISAFLEWNTDVDLAKQQLESQINQIKNDLPQDVQITVEKMNPSILPVMGYSLQSSQYGPVELKLMAKNIVKPYLSRVEGVSSVDVIGGKEKEFHIVLDFQKLSLLKIKPQDIMDAIQQTGFIKSNGRTVDYDRLYLTVTDATLKTKEEIENLVLFNDSLRKIKISDIARVEVSALTEYVKIKADGKDVPLVAVSKQPTSNLIDVATQVNQKVKELNNGVLPKGVVLEPYYNQAEFVQSSIRSIIDVLWMGLLLAIVVTVIFLRSFKASTIILITIPLTLALTFIVIRFIGFDFNIMTIGAIAAAIGLIIDDAIIVVEQIHRTHEEYPERTSRELVGKAITFLFPAMVSSSLSTIVILIPFELMSGVAGVYFKILTETMFITLACSFLVTWIGLPVVYLLLSKDKPLRENMKVAKPHKRNWIMFFIQRPYISFIFVAAVMLSIILVIPRLETGFLPEMDEGSIVLDYTSPPGTSLEETNRMLNEVDKILGTVPEVKAYSRRIGTQMGFFITEPNRGDYLIGLKDKRSRTTEEVIDDIRQKINASLPALVVDFGQVINDMLGDLMNSVQPIEIKIFGSDNEKLKQLSSQVADSLNTVKGVADVFNGIVIAEPVVEVKPKEDRLKLYGLNTSEFHSQLETNMSGTVVGSMAEKEQLLNIRMLYPWSNKIPVEEIHNMQICTSEGNYLPLSMFADINVRKGVAEIQRENIQTMGVVTARLNNRDLGSVVKDIKKKLKDVAPPSYQIVYGGSYAEQQNSFDELMRILLLGGLLVFSVVLFMFRKLKISLIVLFVSLLGVSGSLLALYITQTPLNVGSYTGLIMIIGIIGENSIFTIQQFYWELKNTTVQNALVFAISTRLRPKLMTATGAIVALSPLALGIGTGAQMHQPLAIAVIGGLIIALPLLLIILPSLLKLIHKQN